MISFYRKYRPQKVSELDLVAVREFFERMLNSGKFSHAYLFSGPKGTGKTSAARILAKILNCIKNQKSGVGSKKLELSEPCGKCTSCGAIKSGTSLAVLEMDAASNRGIDDIRSLREKIGLAPVQGDYTVYIVDEVHMLTTEAFNALLKTLEEPPEHAVFILCTTDPGKLPETIISRCTRINFNKATSAEVERSLKKVIKGEKLNIEPEAVKLLAGEVDGSFRDGMKVLEQLAQIGKKIRLAQVEEELGRSKSNKPEELLNLMLKGEVEGAVRELDQLNKQGADWIRLVRAMLERIRVMMRVKVGIGDEKEKGLLESVSLVELEWLVQLLVEAAVQMKSAAIEELPIEIAVIEFCLFRKQSKTKNLKLKVPQYQSPVPVGTGQAVQGKQNQSAKPKSQGTKAKKTMAKVGVKKSLVSLQMIKEKWAELLELIKPRNHSLEALLKATRPVKCDGERLILEVFYKFHKERLEQERYREIIEAELGQMFSWPMVKLQYQLASRRPEPILTKDDNITAKVEDEEIIKAAEEIFGSE